MKSRLVTAAALLAPTAGAAPLAGLAPHRNRRAPAAAELPHAMPAQRDWLAALLDNLGDALFVLDRDWRLVYLNARAEALFDRAAADLSGAILWQIWSDADGTMLQRRLLEAASQETPLSFDVFLARLQRWFSVRACPGAAGLSVYAQDITDRKRVEEALQHEVLHDALTGLPNRALLRDRLQQAILAGMRRQSPFALLFLDLDRFKDVNDAFGHQAGDLLLQEASHRAKGVLRSSDTVARLGGDEFAVLLPDTDATGAGVAAQTLLHALGRPFAVEDRRVSVGGSIGISVFPEHGADAATLMRHADTAMYVAKRSGAGVALYTPDDDRRSDGRLPLPADLQRAITRGELRLHYQPVVRLTDGVPVHVEALVRWQHPRQGLLPPDAFIPLAEQAGLIAGFTRWALQTALAQINDWQQRDVGLGVAVNVSARTLHDPSFIEEVAGLLRSHGVPARRLKLELTESAILVDPSGALATLEALHEMGVRLSIDDFGTGYSSLAHLKRLPVDEIKIDRSFVLDMTINGKDLAIVRSTVELARNLGLQVVAEGIEDRPTWERLRQLGCDLGQGFLISPPLSAEALEIWLGRAEGRGQRNWAAPSPGPVRPQATGMVA